MVYHDVGNSAPHRREVAYEIICHMGLLDLAARFIVRV
jgi:hypothetical protein